MCDKLIDLRSKGEILILAIETSCDETSAAVVENGRTALCNIVSSQIDLHKMYGGVVPEVASRKHIETINPLIDQALKESCLTFKQLDCIAVTSGPGLVGALLVGVSSAKALAYALSLPLVGVNHIEGHISANYIAHPQLSPPFLCLVVSGGHTHIVWVKGYCEYEILGQTRDDAAGEAYDKVARILGLGYPGGAALDLAAKSGGKTEIRFPRAYIDDDNFDFSFSGLKTAVVNHVHQLEQKGLDVDIENIAYNFQKAVIDVLKAKTLKALRAVGTNKLALAGGVAANSALRSEMAIEAERLGFELYIPPIGLCTDNAAMIASAAYYNLLSGKISDLTLNAIPQNTLLTF
jgi:N6-L-threonylcarbamoyladenine synthase